jgi:hypothetical protein
MSVKSGPFQFADVCAAGQPALIQQCSHIDSDTKQHKNAQIWRTQKKTSPKPPANGCLVDKGHRGWMLDGDTFSSILQLRYLNNIRLLGQVPLQCSSLSLSFSSINQSTKMMVVHVQIV